MTYTIKHNTRNKRYVVFKVEGTGFGSYRIEKSCKTRKEAEAYVASK
jgi:hypothetical protein